MVFISSRHWGRGVVSCEQLCSLSQPQYMPQGIEKLKTGENIHILRLQATNQFFLSSLRGAGSDRSEEAVDCDRKEDLIFQRESKLSLLLPSVNLIDKILFVVKIQTYP